MMWCLIVALAVVAGNIKADTDVTALTNITNLSDLLQSRVAVAVTSYAYQVAVLERSTSTHIASGALISTTYALSSALGINGYTAATISVRAGSSLDYSGGTVVYVDSIYIHPDHTTTYDYDLAIIKFSTALTLSTSIAAVSLPTQGAAVSLVSTAALTGWGGPSTYCSEYTQLQYAAITIYANSYCSTNYPSDLINERLICTEYTSGDSTATCIGDPGAPLVVNNVLVGLLAYHYSNGHPVIFTDVSEYVDYINSVISTGSVTTTTTAASTTCSSTDTINFILDLIVTTLQFLITVIQAIQTLL